MLYKPKEKQTISVNIEKFTDGKILFDFYSDCGKFGTDECLSGYIITADKLLEIFKNEKNNNLVEEI